MKLTPRYRERFKTNRRNVRTKAVGFKIDQVSLPDGALAERAYLTHPGAVGVLAFPTPTKILLVKQYRYPVGEFTFEIPAGKLGKGEDPLVCVRRELSEETGYDAKNFVRLIRFWPTAAFSDEVLHLYVAQRLTQKEAHPDPDEFLELLTVTPRQLEAMIRTGRIRDSKTIIAFLLWKSRLRAV